MAIRDSYDYRFDEDVPNETTNQCPECNGRVRTNARETICDDCGLVIDEQQIDHGPEWYSGDEETNRKRTGNPRTPTYHDYGLTTALYGRTDSNGNTLPETKRRQFRRLRTQHWRASWGTKANRNLGHGFTEIRRLVSALSMSTTVRDQACTLFRTAQDHDLLRGRSVESVAAASVYATIRCLGQPRTLADLAEYSPNDEATLRGAYRVLNAELDLPAQPPRPQSYVAKVASALAIPTDVEHRAKYMAKRATETALVTGCNPAGVAAGCLAIVTDEHDIDVLQTELATVADVSTETVRAQRDRIRNELKVTEVVA